MKKTLELIKETIDEFVAVPTLSLGAATAYYAVFSIGPLLVLAAGLGGMVFGEQRMHAEVERQLLAFLGPKSTRLVESMMSAQFKGGSLTTAAIGAIALVIGATGVFTQLQVSLNIIWGVTAKPGHSMWRFIRDRLLSLAMVLAIGFLLLVSMLLTAFVNAFTHVAGQMVSVPDWVAPAFDGLVSFLVTASLFALIFKVLPDVKIRWRDVAIGAAGTAVLFTAGQFLLGQYLRHEISSSAYGAGSAFMVILLYVYYASVVLYLGAEFTRVYAKHAGAPFELSEYAIPVPGRGRVQPGGTTADPDLQNGPNPAADS
jgi:membrane protein